jgi:serine/threonine protein kinase
LPALRPPHPRRALAGPMHADSAVRSVLHIARGIDGEGTLEAVALLLIYFVVVVVVVFGVVSDFVFMLYIIVIIYLQSYDDPNVFTVKLVLEYMQDVANALIYLESLMVHRDVNPSNILGCQDEYAYMCDLKMIFIH